MNIADIPEQDRDIILKKFITKMEDYHIEADRALTKWETFSIETKTAMLIQAQHILIAMLVDASNNEYELTPNEPPIFVIGTLQSEVTSSLLSWLGRKWITQYYEQENTKSSDELKRMLGL